MRLPATSKNEGDRDFDDHERGAKASMAGAGAAARFVFQNVVDRRASRRDCRNETEEQRGEQRDEAKESKHREADARGAEIRHGEELRFRNRGEQKADTPLCRDEADGGAYEREHQAFRQELSGEIGSRGTESGAHGKFLAARDRTREEKIGDVGARDEQNETNSAEQDQQQRANFADDAFAKRAQHDGDRVVFFRIGARELRGDASHLGFGLIGSDTWRQAANDVEPAQAAALSSPPDGCSGTQSGAELL